MAWIETIPEDQAQGLLGELYGRMQDPEHGRVDNVLKIHSLEPEGLEAHWALYRSAMHATKGLRGADREMIAVVVSGLNGCHY